MEIALSVIKVDIGSIGRHIAPSRRLPGTVRDHVAKNGSGLVIHSYASQT